MPRGLSERLVTAVLEHLQRQAGFFEWWVLLEDADQRQLEAELGDVVQRVLYREQS